MKYSPLVNRYAQWLFDLIDRRDCGVRVDGTPRSINTTHCLDNWRDQPYPPKKLTRTHLDSHLRAEDTFYFRSNRKSGFALLMFDIDAHRGEEDARQVADWVIGRYLTGAYSEPSTGGNGMHVYALMRIGKVKRAAANEYFEAVSAALKALVEAQGFDAHVCGIYGTFTTLKAATGRQDKLVNKRGALGKIPRVPDMRSLEELLSGPIFLNFDTILRDYASLAASLPPPAVQVASSGGECNSSDDMGRTTTPTPTDASLADGRTRRAKCVRENLLKSPNVTAEQVLADYRARYPLTEHNNSDEHRLKDFRGMLAKFKVHPGRKLDRKRWLTEVQGAVPDSEFAWSRRERLDHQRLADFISVKLQDAFARKANGYFAMASRDATLKNFRSLKAKGILDWICTPNQYSKLLDIACRYGFLEIYEEYRRPTRNRLGKLIFKGVARVIGPGKTLVEEHQRFLPLYHDWKARHCSQNAA